MGNFMVVGIIFAVVLALVFQIFRILNEYERAVIFLTYWEDLTERETADRTGASERTVRRRLGRARHKLGRLLHE